MWAEPIRQNWSCFPIPRGEKAARAKWERWQTERPDAATVEGWARRDSNIAIVTGAISGLLVLDLDSAEAVAEAEKLGLPDTIRASTAKGQHVYFRHPGGTVKNRAGFKPGWDIRCDGGYVVGPGSLHPSGTEYTWHNPPGLFDLAPPPQWLLDLIAKPAEGNGAGSGGGSHPYALAALDDECEAIRKAPNGAQESTLNAAALKVGHYVGGRCLDHQTARNRLLSAALAMPSHDPRDPWTVEGLSEKIDRALRDGMAEPKTPPERMRFADTPRHDSETGEVHDGAGGVSLDSFRAFMPMHSYIFAPTGEMWPATSVNSRIQPIPLANRNGEPILDKDGKPRTQKANAWLDENRPVEQMTWAPGLPQVIENRLVSDGGWIERGGCNVFNLYRPPLPIAGDETKAQPWLEHVARVYPGDAGHIIRWLAHRVQRPQEKINHALVLGGSQGIGKDTILEGVKAAIGPWNFAEVSPQPMLGRFNGFVKSVILRVSEARDLGDVDRFAFYDHMKTYTAAPPDVLRVDEKHLREYSVFNVCGVIVTTNHKTDGIYLPADDRRHYVAWSPASREEFSEDYWSELWGWYQSGGLGHVAAYLRDLDLSDFNAKAPPAKTAAFWDIVSANATPEDAELADALDHLGSPDAVTIAAIADAAEPAFREYLIDRRNSRKIPHRLEECGYVAVRNPHAKDGLWKVSGKRCAIYARHDLAVRDQHLAAKALAGERYR
ncbi:bifunctional DNA primase/polymerase [Erythrobacter litoralis]|nr:bifunctional DNA primase/polymerase [Erythrobacter litoralis]